jgi:nicotinamidase-related amidase
MAKALVLIDVLEGIFQLPVPLDRPEEFLSVVSDLLARARRAGALVVHVQHLSAPGTRFAEGAPGRRIHPGVAPREGEPVVSKAEPDAFQGSRLEALLSEQGASELVMCGFASEACLDSTVRSAYAHGFSVELASDGHTTTANPVLDAKSIVAHENFVLARFAQVKPSSEIAFA